MIDSILLTTEYFGPVSSYALMAQYDTSIEHYENYQKKSYRNRAFIATPSGIEMLSIPLKSGKNSRCPISEVEISYDTPWIDAHLQSLSTYYGSSPFYEYYIDDIAAILRSEYSHLLELNTALLNHFIKILDITSNISPTETFEKNPSLTVKDMRRYAYKNRQQVITMDKTYQQVWFDRQPFLFDMSILDLLFCKGPESIIYLTTMEIF